MFKKDYDSGTCPFLGGKCIESKCQLWTQVIGKNPQTGQDIDKWDCSIKWLPILIIENSKEARETAAAVESTRNELVKRQDQLNNAIGVMQQIAIERRNYLLQNQ